MTPADTGGLLVSVAHPDDETFACGGLVTLVARRGVPVDIVIATDGAAGEIVAEDMDTPEVRADLATIRRAEARAAAHEVGARSVECLGHADGALSTVPRRQLAGEIAAVIERRRPAVVLTFGPDGVYGHPDHVAVSRATARAFKQTEALRLFYMVISAGMAAQLNEKPGPIELDGVGHPFMGYNDEDITTRVDISSVLDTKLRALARHRSQTGGDVAAIHDRLPSHGRATECLILAKRRVADAPGLEVDPLAGLVAPALRRGPGLDGSRADLMLEP